MQWGPLYGGHVSTVGQYYGGPVSAVGSVLWESC